VQFLYGFGHPGIELIEGTNLTLCCCEKKKTNLTGEQREEDNDRI
jgi:hypothetical protein